MFNINSITSKYASLRNIKLVVDEQAKTLSFVAENDEGATPAFSYNIGPEKDKQWQLTFKENNSLPAEMKEELPHWVPDAIKLRELIAYVAPHFMAQAKVKAA